jgi:hypothetical protein
MITLDQALQEGKKIIALIEGNKSKICVLSLLITKAANIFGYIDDNYAQALEIFFGGGAALAIGAKVTRQTQKIELLQQNVRAQNSAEGQIHDS